MGGRGIYQTAPRNLAKFAAENCGLLHLFCVFPSVCLLQADTAHDPFSVLMPSIISPERLKRDSKFCMQVGYIKCYLCYDKLPANMHGHGLMTCFFKFRPSIMSGISESWHFKLMS